MCSVILSLNVLGLICCRRFHFNPWVSERKEISYFYSSGYIFVTIFSKSFNSDFFQIRFMDSIKVHINKRRLFDL